MQRTVMLSEFCPSVRLSVRQADACIVTKLKSNHIYWYMAALRLDYTITQSRRTQSHKVGYNKTTIRTANILIPHKMAITLVS